MGKTFAIAFGAMSGAILFIIGGSTAVAATRDRWGDAAALGLFTGLTLIMCAAAAALIAYLTRKY